MDFLINKKEKIYHRLDCECCNSIDYGDRIYINDSLFRMYEKGYKPCPICSPLLKQYELEKEEIHKFVLEKGIRIRFRDECLLIDTHISSWKIIKGFHGTKSLILYHENEQLYCKCYNKKGEIIKKYHNQGCHYKTIMEYLRYIVNHDEYKDKFNNKYRKTKKSNRTKKYLYKRAQTKNINIGTKRVLNLLEEIETQRK